MIITINNGEDDKYTFSSKDLILVSYHKDIKTDKKKFDVLKIILKYGESIILYSHRIPNLEDLYKKMLEIMEDEDANSEAVSGMWSSSDSTG